MKTILSTILILTIMGCPLSFAKGGHSSKGHSSKGKSNSVHGVKLSHHKQKLSEKDVI